MGKPTDTPLACAIAARLPIVTVRTTDTLSLGKLLLRYAASNTSVWSPQLGDPKDKRVYVWDARVPLPVALEPVARLFNEHESTLVIVNPAEPIGCAYDAGEVEYPDALRVEKLRGLRLDDRLAALTALNGLTPKEVEEAVRLTQARGAACTPVELAFTRSRFFTPPRGLVPVPPLGDDFYVQDGRLEKWVERERAFLLDAERPASLRPRGLLLHGVPGTGKTLAAKWMAQALGVPLYRLDLGGMKSKFVGESEAALVQALRRAEREAPCVLLIDEVEKFTAGRDDSSGVTGGMLAALLWWLQEHRARVLTMMTTNDLGAVPPELVRPGRIDEQFEFGPLDFHDACRFLARFLRSYPLKTERSNARALMAANTKLRSMKKATPADVTRIARYVLKTNWE